MGDRATITVVWGEEVFAPVRFHHFKVGPFTYTTEILVGETPDAAFKRANKFLADHADKVFLAKRNAFMERLAVSKL